MGSCRRKLFVEQFSGRVLPGALAGVLDEILLEGEGPFDCPFSDTETEPDPVLVEPPENPNPPMDPIMQFDLVAEDAELFVGESTSISVIARDLRTDADSSGIFAAAADVILANQAMGSGAIEMTAVEPGEFWLAGEAELVVDKSGESASFAHFAGIDPALIDPGQDAQLLGTIEVTAVAVGPAVVISAADADPLTENLPYCEEDTACEHNGEIDFGSVWIDVIEPFAASNGIDPNRDGCTDVFDVLGMVEHIHDNGVYDTADDGVDDYEEFAPDINDDGLVTAIDLMVIVKEVAAQADC